VETIATPAGPRRKRRGYAKAKKAVEAASNGTVMPFSTSKIILRLAIEEYIKEERSITK
jgi:hypothetical protein